MNICEKERKYFERLRREMRSNCCVDIVLHFMRINRKKSTEQRFACDFVEARRKNPRSQSEFRWPVVKL